MAMSEKIRERLETRIADSILLLIAGAIAVAGYFFSDLLPEKAIQSLDQRELAQALGAILPITLLLAAWVLALRWPRKLSSASPTKTFLKHLGFWEEAGTGNYYCAKCTTTPLAEVEAGWYCVKCPWLYESNEHKEKMRLRKEEEDRRVREFNNSQRI